MSEKRKVEWEKVSPMVWRKRLSAPGFTLMVVSSEREWNAIVGRRNLGSWPDINKAMAAADCYARDIARKILEELGE